MNKIIGVIVALIVVGGGAYYIMHQSEPIPEVYSEKPAMVDSEELVMADEQKSADETPTSTTPESAQYNPKELQVDKAQYNPKELQVDKGMFLAYSPSEVTSPMTEDVVLAFLADWCPSCRAVKSDIQANLGSIPGNLTILDVDYDEYTDLKKQYGITQQHTFVQVDKTGAVIKTWKGGNTLESVIAQVN